MKLKIQCLALLWVAALRAADFTPPPEAISLEDPRMAEFVANPKNMAVVTGKFVDLPPGAHEKIVLTCYEPVLLGARGQASRAVPVAADGSFKIAFAHPVPLRKIMLRMVGGEVFGTRSITVTLMKGLDVTCKYLPEKTGITISIAGPDKQLNEEVEGFVKYEREKQKALLKRLPTASVDVADFDAALADFNEAKKGMDELLRAYAPAKYGWVLQDELDARYMMAVLSSTFCGGHRLEDKPEWKQVLAFQPRLFHSLGLAYYAYLGMYLDRTNEGGVFRLNNEEKRALLERRLRGAAGVSKSECDEFLALTAAIDAKLPVDAARLKELYRKLGDKMLLQPDAKVRIDYKIRIFRGRVPDEKIGPMLLHDLPEAPAEALEAIPSVRAFLGESWLKWVVAEAVPGMEARAAKVNATIAEAAARSIEGMGEAKVLPSGAKLYRFPSLSGADLLGRIKAANAGKVLIIDFWGPWCMPCMQDLPHSEKAHATVKDAAVEFVYFGCRTSEKPWTEAIARLGLSGTHVMLTERQNDELMALFQRTGYPSYVLIDRKGEAHTEAIRRFAQMKPEELRKLVE